MRHVRWSSDYGYCLQTAGGCRLDQLALVACAVGHYEANKSNPGALGPKVKQGPYAGSPPASLRRSRMAYAPARCRLKSHFDRAARRCGGMAARCARSAKRIKSHERDCVPPIGIAGPAQWAWVIAQNDPDAGVLKKWLSRPQQTRRFTQPLRRCRLIPSMSRSQRRWTG